MTAGWKGAPRSGWHRAGPSAPALRALPPRMTGNSIPFCGHVLNKPPEQMFHVKHSSERCPPAPGKQRNADSPSRPFLHVQKLPLDNSSLAQYYTYTPIGTKMHRRTTHEGDDGHARTLAGTTRRTARSRRHEKGRRAAGRVGRRAGIQLLRARDAALQPGLDRIVLCGAPIILGAVIGW